MTNVSQKQKELRNRYHVYVYVIALQSVRMEIFAHLYDIKTWR